MAFIALTIAAWGRYGFCNDPVKQLACHFLLPLRSRDISRYSKHQNYSLLCTEPLARSKFNFVKLYKGQEYFKCSAVLTVKGEAKSATQRLVAGRWGSLQLLKQRHLLLPKCLQVFLTPSSCQPNRGQGSIGLHPICRHFACPRYSWGIQGHKMFGQPR